MSYLNAMGAKNYWCTTGAETPKPFKVYNLSQIIMVPGHGMTELNVCSALFWTCFGPIAFYLPISTLSNTNVYVVSLYIRNV